MPDAREFYLAVRCNKSDETSFQERHADPSQQYLRLGRGVGSRGLENSGLIPSSTGSAHPIKPAWLPRRRGRLLT